MRVDPESVPQKEPGFRLEILDGEILLLRPSDGLIVQCNQTAGAVWELCDGSRSAQQVAALFSDAYGDTRRDVASDVYEILATLAEADVISLR